MKTVEDYIKNHPEKTRIALQKMRQAIKKAVPKAEETISYGMPAFKYYGIVCWYAGHKDYSSIYVRPKFLDAFKKEIMPYRTSLSTLKFALGKPIPVQLITKIVKYVAKENLKNKK